MLLIRAIRSVIAALSSDVSILSFMLNIKAVLRSRHLESRSYTKLALLLQLYLIINVALWTQILPWLNWATRVVFGVVRGIVGGVLCPPFSLAVVRARTGRLRHLGAWPP